MSHIVHGSATQTPSKQIQAGKHSIVAGGNVKRDCKRCCKAITIKWQKTYCSQECRVVSNRERVRKRCADNPEKAREMSMLWNKNNPEKVKEASRRYYKNNVEKIKEANRRYYKNNAEKVHARNRQRRKDNLKKAREYGRRHAAKRRKIIKDNTERWVENYLAKVREGAKAERDAGRENHDNNNRQQHEAFGSMPTGGEMK